MRKIVLKDKEHFHTWQAHTMRGVDDSGQIDLSVMAPPAEYPVILVWSFHEEYDTDGRYPNVPIDKLQYRYVYVGDFPVKHIKQGTYVYQVFQTGDGSADV